MREAPVIVWFRRDLRVTDNPALREAAESGQKVLPLYILDEETGERPMGDAGRWWLHGSLEALAALLKMRNAELILRRGEAARVLDDVIAETGATAVFWNRLYEPATIARDTAIKTALEARGIEARSFNASLLHEPWTIATKSGAPYRVFTPFWRACLAAAPPPKPVPAPATLHSAIAESELLADWCLLPTTPDWAEGLRACWTPGEAAAQASLDAFLGEKLTAYRMARDMPAVRGTSRLSPHLHFGEIGPGQIWHAALACCETSASLDRFLAELGWREFCHHLLFHFPHMHERNLRGEFDLFSWRKDHAALRAWQRGMTGFPIVDAGMRELWQTGFMHNRVRMITASFLVKDLLLDWREGEAWFWDTLVDADLAANAANWQWVAGCGADAAPYFRVFHPVLQGETFDAGGGYVRRFVPELAALPDAYLHKPWLAPADVLAQAGVTLGKSYPHPIVDHAKARKRALEAFAALRAPLP